MPTEDEEIGAFITDALARRRAGERAQRDDRATRSSMPGFLATAAQGLTFGFGDELTAGARSLFGRTPYDTALAEERAGLEKYREDHPMMAMGAELAGSLPTALIPGLGAARLAQGAAQVAQGANRFGTVMRAGAAPAA